MKIRRNARFLMLALVLAPLTARAQGASLAVGAATPSADLAKSAGPGFDADFQVMTDAKFGPLAFRLDIGYDHFSGKNGANSFDVSSQSLSLASELGPSSYFVVGPGYFQSTEKTQISGHNVSIQAQYLSAQVLAGLNFSILGTRGYLEAGAIRLFTPGQVYIMFPLRVGLHL